MSTASFIRRSAPRPHAAAWLPLAVLPVAAGLLASELPAWAFMWLLALAIYAGLKWLSLADFVISNGATSHRVPLAKAMGYLLVWPGMDAAAFFGAAAPARPRPREWVAAIAKTALGLWLFFAVAPALLHSPTVAWPLAAAWVGMTGIALALHFGVFHLISVWWRTAGVHATPIMHAPALATSLADFWSNRWNLAFRDLAHRWVFRPLVGRVGIAWAMMAVFLASGLIHDVVISLAARGGFGLPTLYFLLQGGAVLLERSRVGKAFGLGRGLLGRAFAALVVLAPVGLLFHRAFVEQVVLPMIELL